MGTPKFHYNDETGQYEWDADANRTLVDAPLLVDIHGEIKDEAGNKWDGDKLRYDLVPVRALHGVVTVLTYGAKKYGDRNWEKGISFMRLYAAAQRHLADWCIREDLDQESKLLHLDHAICDLMMMREMIALHPEKDDRP